MKELATTRTAHISPNGQPQTDRAREAWLREMCVIWTARAMAFHACKGDPDSPFTVMRDVFNDMIGREGFSSSEFFKYAPNFGIDPYKVESITDDAYTMCNEFYKAHRDK